MALVPLAAAGIGALFGLAMLVLYIGIIVWVYSDAQTNSPHSPVLWALVVFFAPFLGLILYWLLGRTQA
ncbi:PLDc N-terminal domain-containing protein [Halorubrum vacuolatum]|uniref:Phospholipase_D-nuclease N-terminal n=1 Tax=Halorubrum vacuolatum TaxID=63740 RepID=A0A238VEY4_HALVU|nr:PLDc N-terminal domain-containing protein [Halorubrum vacuolatum]SNR32771.1 Phospholipase_D-nuclease N-terminal [Halorubrum vacuolatum]